MSEWQPLIAWAFAQQTVVEPSARFVLTCLAHHANKDGANSFPSVATLVKYTGLSERTVRSSLRTLEAAGLIRRGLPTTQLRADRRPVCYDLQIERGATIAPRESTGCNERLDGVQPTTSRGATIAPDLPSRSPIKSKSVLQTVLKTENEKRGEFERLFKTLAQQKKV